MKLFKYDWFYKLMTHSTLVEYLVVTFFIGLIIWV